MVGGGSAIQGMQTSLNNNWDLRRKRKSLKEINDKMLHNHIKSNDPKRMTEEERVAFQQKLRKERAYNLKVTIGIVLVVIGVIAALLLVITR